MRRAEGMGTGERKRTFLGGSIKRLFECLMLHIRSAFKVVQAEDTVRIRSFISVAEYFHGEIGGYFFFFSSLYS